MILLALAAYVLASSLHVAYLATRRLPLARAGTALAAAGLLAHAASYGADCVGTKAMVVMSARGSFSLLALCTVAVLLVLTVRHGLHIVGAFVLPLAAAALAVAAAAPLPPAPPGLFKGALFPLHVVTSFLGIAGLTAAFGVALAYLVQHRELKSRRPDQLSYALPPLDALDALLARIVRLALGVLALGILTGMLWSRRTEGSWWPHDPKSAATLVSWLVYALAALLREGAGWRGRRHALAVVAGFVLVLVAFAGLGHLPPPSP